MKIDDRIREEAARWFAAQRRGPMPVDERAAFDGWRADPVNQAALNSMHELWGEVAGIGEFGARVPHRGARQHRWLAAAAAMLALLIAGAIYLAIQAMPGTPQQLATAIGEQRTATLPDGSVATLNVATRLAYDAEGPLRRVDMDQGEAIFFVHKDPARPFLVRAGGYEVRAVGTAFNVRYRGQEVEISVLEGIVAVVARDGPRAGQELARLGAGRRLALGPAESLTPTPVRPVAMAANNVAEWRMRTLDYEDAPLSRVVEDLNLFFERPIAIGDPALANQRVTLRLQVEDRERAIALLAALVDAQVRRGASADTLAGGPLS